MAFWEMGVKQDMTYTDGLNESQRGVHLEQPVVFSWYQWSGGALMRCGV